MFFTSKFSYLLFFAKLGQRIGGVLLIANNLDQSETLSSSLIIFMTLFSGGVLRLLPATTAKCSIEPIS